MAVIHKQVYAANGVAASVTVRTANLASMAALEDAPPTWGPVVSTQKAKCPSCDGWAIVKVYQNGAMEAHCIACGHQGEV